MIVAVVGPSGAGKDTLIAGALAQDPQLRVVRRVITRPSAAGGEDFEGVTEEVFAARKAAGDFILDWQAHGLFYGLPAAAFVGGGTVLFNGSRATLAAAVRLWPDLRVILVTAPEAVLQQRLGDRGREAGADQKARLARAAEQLPAGLHAVTVVNDGTEAEGIARFLAALYPASA